MHRGSLRSAAIGIAVLPVILGGCAEGQRPAIEGVVSAFGSAMASGDARAACALLTAATLDAVEYRQSQPCAAVLAQLSLPGGDIIGTAEWGDQAQVHTTTDTLFLTRTSQGWRISAAGCSPRGEAPYACKVEGP